MLLLVLGIGNGHTQTNKIKKIELGERVPNLSLGELYNYKGPEKNLGDFKGKLLILDFWATWCGPCIAAFPKMEALRKKFKDYINIIPVTVDPNSKVEPLFRNLSVENGWELFSIVNDRAIANLFSFKTVPYYAWIDKDGVYLGDSFIDDITEERIREIISGRGSFRNERKQIKIYDNKNILFNFVSPLTVNGQYQTEQIANEQVLASGVLTKSLKGVKGSQVLLKNRYVAVNTSIGKMLGFLLGNSISGVSGISKAVYFLVDNRIIWDVSDERLLEFSSKYMNKLAEKNVLGWRQFMEDHRFCYEYKVRDSLDRDLLSKMAFDNLNRQLKILYNLSAFMEKRKIKCLVLKRTSEIDKLAAAAVISTGENEVVRTNFYDQQVIGKPYRDFILPLIGLQLQGIAEPIIDETGFDFKKIVDIKLDGNMTNWQSVNNALAKYDLAFVEAEREIDIVVITDKQSMTDVIK